MVTARHWSFSRGYLPLLFLLSCLWRGDRAFIEECLAEEGRDFLRHCDVPNDLHISWKTLTWSRREENSMDEHLLSVCYQDTGKCTSVEKGLLKTSISYNSSSTVIISNITPQLRRQELLCFLSITVGIQNDEQSNTVETHNGEQSNTVGTHNGEQSNTVETHNVEESNTVGTQNGEQSNAVRTQNDEQSNNVRAHNGEKSNTVVTQNIEQSNTLRTRNGEQSNTLRTHNGIQSSCVMTVYHPPQKPVCAAELGKDQTILVSCHTRKVYPEIICQIIQQRYDSSISEPLNDLGMESKQITVSKIENLQIKDEMNNYTYFSSLCSAVSYPKLSGFYRYQVTMYLNLTSRSSQTRLIVYTNSLLFNRGSTPQGLESLRQGQGSLVKSKTIPNHRAESDKLDKHSNYRQFVRGNGFSNSTGLIRIKRKADGNSNVTTHSTTSNTSATHTSMSTTSATHTSMSTTSATHSSMSTTLSLSDVQNSLNRLEMAMWIFSAIGILGPLAVGVAVLLKYIKSRANKFKIYSYNSHQYESIHSEEPYFCLQKECSIDIPPGPRNLNSLPGKNETANSYCTQCESNCESLSICSQSVSKDDELSANTAGANTKDTSMSVYSLATNTFHKDRIKSTDSIKKKQNKRTRMYSHLHSKTSPRHPRILTFRHRFKWADKKSLKYSAANVDRSQEGTDYDSLEKVSRQKQYLIPPSEENPQNSVPAVRHSKEAKEVETVLPVTSLDMQNKLTENPEKYSKSEEGPESSLNAVNAGKFPGNDLIAVVTYKKLGQEKLGLENKTHYVQCTERASTQQKHGRRHGYMRCSPAPSVRAPKQDTEDSRV